MRYSISVRRATNMALGATSRSTAEYMLVCRSIDHSRLRGLARSAFGNEARTCSDHPDRRFRRHGEVCSGCLQSVRTTNLADYDPTMTCSASEVRLAVSDVREAMIWFKSCSLEQQRAFLTMLLFRARSPSLPCSIRAVAGGTEACTDQLLAVVRSPAKQVSGGSNPLKRRLQKAPKAWPQLFRACRLRF
jgi:hypothetical protein